MCELCFTSVSRRRILQLVAAGAVAATLPAGHAVAQADDAIEVTPGLRIRPRSAWAGDRGVTGPLQSEDVRFLLVHHTATPNGGDPVSMMRAAYNLHTGPDKGWPDVAYNFFVDQFGVVWEARQGSLAGPVEASATGGSQGFAQLVCLLGTFTDVLPTAEALASLNRVLAWLADRYGVDTTPGATTSFVSRGSNRWAQGETVNAATISGHRDMSFTACPGDTFYPYLVNNVAAEVSALRGTPTATTPAPTSAPPQTTASPDTVAPPATEPAESSPDTQPAATTTTTADPIEPPAAETGSASTSQADQPTTAAAPSPTLGDVVAAPSQELGRPPEAVIERAPDGTSESTGDSGTPWAAVALISGLAIAASGGAVTIAQQRDSRNGS